jgi:hypothetical protein
MARGTCSYLDRHPHTADCCCGIEIRALLASGTAAKGGEGKRQEKRQEKRPSHALPRPAVLQLFKGSGASSSQWLANKMARAEVESVQHL